ncbi:MAG TPA: hypothetical protein VGC66_11680 [Pyrinomonadaceae bacterium]|jgi:hypothetical protein
MKSSKLIALAAIALVIGIASLACSGFGSSPTATLKAYFEAMQKKDAAGLKKTLSKGTLEMFEQFAKAQSPPKTLDEALQTGLSSTTSTDSNKMPETRNEKIDGDKATLEVKNDKTGQWETVPFVKEEGSWKIAFDQMFRDLKKPGSSTGNANSSDNK